MRTRTAVIFVVVAASLFILHTARRSTHAQPNPPATAEQPEVQHGKYIVHHVAMCVECHTPRTAEGSLDLERLLAGAPVPVESPFEGQRWAFQAPKLAGLPGGWSEQDLTKFLQTGTTTNGLAPQPPMPPFRMNERDAAAVTAYLKSLP